MREVECGLCAVRGSCAALVALGCPCLSPNAAFASTTRDTRVRVLVGKSVVDFGLPPFTRRRVEVSTLGGLRHQPLGLRHIMDMLIRVVVPGRPGDEALESFLCFSFDADV